MKLNTVASAYTAFWLPGRDQIVYVTPQDLAPLPGGRRKHTIYRPIVTSPKNQSEAIENTSRLAGK
jgi:hypothetical protein